MSAPFRHRLRVRYGECDLQGHVFNANYLAYADVAMTELYREAFGAWVALVAEYGVDMVVAEANLRFQAPVRFDDEIELVATVTRIGLTSTTTHVAIAREGTAAAEVELRHVFVDPDTFAKAPMPDEVRAALARYSQ